jgi:hypothetical protein
MFHVKRAREHANQDHRTHGHARFRPLPVPPVHGILAPDVAAVSIVVVGTKRARDPGERRGSTAQ